MTAQSEALDRLIAAVEAGNEAAAGETLREINKDARMAGNCWPAHDAMKAYRGSLDAAKALHDALLPGCFPGLSQNIHSGQWYAWVRDGSWQYGATHSDPARAWLLAILKAYRITLQ